LNIKIYWPEIKCLCLCLFLFGDIVSALEEPEYQIIKNTPDFEIRYYNEYLVAEVTLTGDFTSSGNQAFKVLAGYIFGANQASTKMKMTAPVESQAISVSEEMKMTAPVMSVDNNSNEHVYRFVMEKKYTLDTLPTPNDKRIRLIKVTPRFMAVKKFSGRWSEKNYQKSEKLLLKSLNLEKIETIGLPIFARYNAPFVPWFLRRNEIMIQIDWDS
tara:strand:+ start:5048 stop:5692 length:645 start_codon:yes stop_codon:yes gene_type:complete